MADPGAEDGRRELPVVRIHTDRLAVQLSPQVASLFREQAGAAARREKRLAAEAGNAANTAQLVGGTFGATITGGGMISWATSSGSASFPVVVITLAGAFVMGLGFTLGHWMNKKKIAHEEKMDQYLERVEVLK